MHGGFLLLYQRYEPDVVHVVFVVGFHGSVAEFALVTCGCMGDRRPYMGACEPTCGCI